MSERKKNITRELGQRIATYHGRRRARGVVWFLLALGVSIFLLGSVDGFPGTLNFPATLNRFFQVLGFCSFASGLIFLVRWRVPYKVQLHQQGCAICHGRRKQTVLWDELREMYQSPTYFRYRIPWTSTNLPPVRWSYRLVCEDGRVIRLAHLEGIRGLAHRIEHELTQRLYPAANDSLQTGFIVRFGRKLGLSDQGLYLGATCIPWHQIVDVSVDEYGYVHIARAHEHISSVQVPASQVSNLQLFSRLLESVRDDITNVTKQSGMQVDEFGVMVDTELRTDSGHDVNDLLDQGYDLEEIREVLDGERTVDELYPRHGRPRYPR